MNQTLQLHRTTIDSPLGELVALTAADGVYLLEFADKENLEEEIEVFCSDLSAQLTNSPCSTGQQLENELYGYFEGKVQQFSTPLKLSGTSFQVEVWTQLTAVPYGEQRSYKQQAEAIGKPESVRAVANANGANHIVILIPCHRIVGSNGKLTGYSGGVWRKKELLRLEQKFAKNTLSLF